MLPQEFLQRWQSQRATVFQVDLLLRISEALEESPECLGAAIVGSFAKGSADRVSDLDLIIFCTEGSGEALLSRVCAEVPEVFLAFEGSHGPGSPFREFILYNFTSVEVHVIAPSTTFTLKQPYVKVVDRSGVLLARASNKVAPGRGELVPYRHGDKWLPWELFNCIKWLPRGEVAAEIGRAHV